MGKFGHKLDLVDILHLVDLVSNLGGVRNKGSTLSVNYLNENTYFFGENLSTIFLNGFFIYFF